MYATDRQTDVRRQTKASLNASVLWGRRHNNNKITREATHLLCPQRPELNSSCTTSREVAGLVAQQSCDNTTGRTTGREVTRLVARPVLRLDSALITHDHAHRDHAHRRQVVVRPSYDRPRFVCDRLRPSIAATGILNMFDDLPATDFDSETPHDH